MDYMKQERERGITITSATITFGWDDCRINLIDTPGHVDFTVEVERSIRVLDGAVTIIDGVAGIQAQTLTVWNQANRYNLPRIIYINKMDREGANFYRAWKSVKLHLKVPSFPLQIPLLDAKSERIVGVYDLIYQRLTFWTDANGVEMQNIKLTNLNENNTKGLLIPSLDSTLFKPISKEDLEAYREHLIETLMELDDELLEMDIDKITTSHIIKSVRNITINNRGVPVLCGSSLKNIGVQPLLDAIVEYLPCPFDRPLPNATSIVKREEKVLPVPIDNRLVALAFKVVYDKQRGGYMTFVRVYSGELKPQTVVYNTTRKVKERLSRVLQMYADETEDLPSLTAGRAISLY
jgi:elongation factor G